MGMVKIASKTFCHRSDKRKDHHAAKIPSIKIMTMAVRVVLSVTHRGEKSRSWKNSARAANPVAAWVIAVVSLEESTA